MSDITQLLLQIEAGNRESAEKLLPLVYEELKVLARQRLAHEQPGQTLQATALVHEAYLRLVGNRNWGTAPTLADRQAAAAGSTDGQVPGRERAHFFGAAGNAMRRILVENARRKAAVKHGGNRNREPLNDVASPEAMSPLTLLALDEALQNLARTHPMHAKLIELQFFAGLEQREAAACLNISVRTARRYWLFARAWLFEELAVGSAEHRKNYLR